MTQSVVCRFVNAWWMGRLWCRRKSFDKFFIHVISFCFFILSHFILSWSIRGELIFYEIYKKRRRRRGRQTSLGAADTSDIQKREGKRSRKMIENNLRRKKKKKKKHRKSIISQHWKKDRHTAAVGKLHLRRRLRWVRNYIIRIWPMTFSLSLF